jgi:kojibiose phosphorylase
MSTLEAPPLIARDTRYQHWITTTDPTLEPRWATQFALSNGFLGLRGSHEEMPGWGSPGFFVSGTYCNAPQKIVPIHPPDHILTHPERIKPEHHAEYTMLRTMPNLPNPVAVRVTIGGEALDLATASLASCERMLEIREARMWRRLVIRDSAWRRTIIDSERFVSWADINLVCFRYQLTPDAHDAALTVAPFINTDVTNAQRVKLFEIAQADETPGLNVVIATVASKNGEIAIAQAYSVSREGAALVLDVVAAASLAGRDDAVARAQAGLAQGYDALRAAHLAAVQAAFARSHFDIDADPASIQGLHFGHLHLESAFDRESSEVSVPIKGLTGEGYRFMVFWDTDFHLFPYYLLTDPQHARHMLEYRYRQLDAYRQFAASWGYKGAQIPWETGLTGEEETAQWLCLQEREIHISADTALAIKHYDEWANDPSLLVDFGAEIVLETARFYASRAQWVEAHARYEILDIGCPDQYHTFADNNAFISHMARLNMDYALELAADPRLVETCARIGLTAEELAAMRTVAEGLYCPEPGDDGIIPEFDGMETLSTDLRGISERFCSHTQAIKQPDSLILFNVFPGRYDLEIQQANWHYCAARTIHGSSLSLPGMALAAAQCDLLDEALPYFQRSTRMDLDDVNGDTRLGVHLAGYAVLWETVVFGFGGLRLTRDAITLAPRLPRLWGGLTFTITWHAQRFTVKVDHDGTQISADAANTQSIPINGIHIAPGETVGA